MKLFLIGFMGAGKSYLGKQLAKRLSIPFFDTDKLFVDKFMLSIPLYIEQYGMPKFRTDESDILQSTCFPVHCIIATGGGAVELASNREFLKTQETVYLAHDWEILATRIMDSERPLVKKMNAFQLRELYMQRHPYYADCAKFCIANPDIEQLSTFLHDKF